MLERHFTAERINEIVNHPSIYPTICGFHTEPLDVTAVAANPNHVCLVGEHGCVLFIKHQAGVYEFHTSVLPEGRGEWMVAGSREAFSYMFTQTDAFELMTKCPHGNLPAKVGAKVVGCSPRFTTRALWPHDGGLVPIDVFSIMIQEWVKNADRLVESGKSFHLSLDLEYTRLGKAIETHDDDDVHDRYVGATIEMIRGGQVAKAINFYNRWACMSNYKQIKIASTNPIIIDIDEAKLRITNNNFEVMTCQQVD